MKANLENKLSEFFHGKEASFRLFKVLRKVIEKNCPAEITVMKTQIAFGEVYKYIWIWLPQTWIKKRPADSITMTIVTGKKIRSPKIVQSVQPKKGFWTHHIIIKTKEEIDKELAGLIKESYYFYLNRLEKKARKIKS